MPQSQRSQGELSHVSCVLEETVVRTRKMQSGDSLSEVMVELYVRSRNDSAGGSERMLEGPSQYQHEASHFTGSAAPLS